MININQTEFTDKAQDQKYKILDVRSPDECAAGMISNAKMINFMDRSGFLAEIEQLDKSTPYLIYCRSGNRSGQACTMMDAMGFSETYNLDGGMMGWKGDLSI